MRLPGTASVESFESAAADERGALREISTAMVQTYKDQFGRGPTKVRTNYAGRDVLVCTLTVSNQNGEEAESGLP